MLLQDKVAIVTGTATGIGEGIAQLFVAQGAHVFMLDRDAERNEEAAKAFTMNSYSNMVLMLDVPVLVMLDDARWATPKSMIFARPSSPMRMLAGLMSRCTMPRL